jgi:molybdopterin synthase sulfur carrier subunit
VIAVKVHTILHLVGALGGRQLTVELPEGTTLAECLRRLAAQLGEPAQGVLFSTPDGVLQAHIQVLVNGRQPQFLAGSETVLVDGDDLLFLPPVGGG